MSSDRRSKQYRQGDVFLKPIEKLPQEAQLQNSQSVIVLAYGEVTGHAHVVDAALAALYKSGQKDFLLAKEGAVLRHEEHSALTLEPGYYEVIRQREYEPSAWRNVAD